MLNRFRSLRWRLQAWYTGILILVITGLSSVIHWQITRAQWDRVDEDLLAAARILEGSLRAVPREILESMSQDLSIPPGPRLPERDRTNNPPPPRFSPSSPTDLRRPSFRPPNEPMRPPRSGRENAGRLDWDFPGEAADLERRTPEEWEASIALPRSLPEQLGHHEGPAYFVIWRSDLTVMRRSNTPDEVIRQFGEGIPGNVRQLLEHDRYAWQQKGRWREIYINGPRGTYICVGRSVVGEQDRTSRLTWSLTVTGISILCLGTLGGWWIISKAIEPIRMMSITAGNIHANQLSQRMDLKGVDSELAQLGSVLNDMLDRLAASIEQQKRFTADASHELRTPLSVILSSSELALSKDRTGEEYREHLQKCHRAASRMRNLIESLLTLSRFDSQLPIQERSQKIAQIDLSQVTNDSVQLIMPLAKDGNIEVINEVQPFWIAGNADQLGQAFVNLLSNAVKYNVPGGSVRIISKMVSDVHGASIFLEITDTGIGIQEKDLPHLFERFYRVDQSRTSGQAGTGLGLAITERIVAAHYGEIGVRSKPGEGSTFWIRLPIENKPHKEPTNLVLSKESTSQESS